MNAILNVSIVADVRTGWLAVTPCIQALILGHLYFAILKDRPSFHLSPIDIQGRRIAAIDRDCADDKVTLKE